MNEENAHHPHAYYLGESLEAIEVIEDYNLDFCLGNVVKYVLRAGKKENALNDLKKARWYLERTIAKME